ncbi:DNA-directed RNA polymerase II subunit rpb1 [Rhizophlyctis rosea]|nr:DNA-directed RNA polymerase II subunit rpb1 [Rhizophlyctis rosea]
MLLSPSTAPVKDVHKIHFSILSPKLVRAYSVAKIEYPDLFDNQTREPRTGGLSDLRMGSIDSKVKCWTCMGTINDCTGHFGHIELATPVYHIKYWKVVKKIIECVCTRCSRFRLLPTDHRYSKFLRVKDNFDFAWKAAKGKMVCEYCETPFLPIRHRKRPFQLYQDVKRLDKKVSIIPFSPKEVRKILERISDDDCRLIGLNSKDARLEWFILTVLLVPPPCVRPSVNMDSDGKGEDDLTHILGNIIRFNNAVKTSETAKAPAANKEQLILHVICYMDNAVAGIPQVVQKSHRPIRAIRARLKGKDGRVRNNMMGKRVDFSARSVITGDPNNSIAQVGVPKSVASTLTYRKTVTDINKDFLQTHVERGSEHPGAKYIFRTDKPPIDLKFAKKKPILEVGDVVERHLIAGDPAMFNRQPTLHRPL